MKKISYILLSLLICICFSLWCCFNKEPIKVSQINTPSSFILNNNKIINLDIEVISYKNKGYCLELHKSLKLPIEDIYAIGYLADSYAEMNLRNATLDINKYKSELIKTGYVFNNKRPINPEKFDERLKYVKNKKFVLYNNDSKKYHKLSCKHALTIQNPIIIPYNDLPHNIVPCRYCQNINVKQKETRQNHKKTNTAKLIYQTDNIKIILTDYTKNLVPSRSHKSDIAWELINHINKAETSIDIAIFGYDEYPPIEEALYNAINRGIKIRLIHDINSKGENIYKDTLKLTKLLTNCRCDNNLLNIDNNSQYTNSLMHNKFYIFDSKTVITGSANLSYTDLSGYNSNCIITINSPKIAKIYEEEFEQMYLGKFHKLKNKNNIESIKLGTIKLDTYFSPQDNSTHNAIIPLINNAKKYIYIPAFLITDADITEALIMAKNKGIDIKIIIDAVNAKSKASKHKILRENGILVKTENYAGKLHSKSMIIDDKYTLIGSMNFSKAGNYKNDENLIILKDKNIAIFYREFFEYLWNKIKDYWLTHDVSAESIYSIGSCSDGIDNDYDGKIDSEDEGCQRKN